MGTFMSNKSHASNLLKYNAVDDKASALLSTGHGGKPDHTHDEPRTGYSSKVTNARSNPNATATDVPENEAARKKIERAKIAAERMRLYNSKDPKIKKFYSSVKTLKDIGKYGQ